MDRHNFQPSAQHDDYCKWCGNPREAACHDTFSSSDTHPGLARLPVEARLAALLGCNVEELRKAMRELVLTDVRAVGAFEDHRVSPAILRCRATIDDDCRCERAPGHPGLHTHMNELWDTHPDTLAVRLRFRRCYAVHPKSTASLSTYRCVRELGHAPEDNGAAGHTLDNGEVFS